MPKKIEDIISEYGFYITSPKGTSMYPMIKPDCREICILKAESVQKYDVALYIRKSGDYVLHRILDKNENGYICCGDNQWTLEYNVTEDMIIGKLDYWYKGKKKHTVNDKGYLRYVKFWCGSLKRRRFILFFMHLIWRTKNLCREILKKFFGKNK